MHTAHLVAMVDRGQHGGHIGKRYPSGDAAPSESDALAHEQVAVGTGDIVQVDRCVEVAGDGAHRRFCQRRVPTINWVSPPDSW